jgi:cytochrome oxidase assembly protein ShyY1
MNRQINRKRWSWLVVVNVICLSLFGLFLSLGPVSAQFSPPDTPPNRTAQTIRWDYRSVSATQEDDPNFENFTQQIQDLGDLGFEMVTCLYAPDNRRSERSTTACYFKRPQS